MFAWFLILILVISAVGVLLGIIIAIISKDIEWLCVSTISVVISLIPMMIMGVHITEHVHDIGTVRHADNFIHVRQQAITDIDEQLITLKAQYTNGSVLLNADTPAKTLIETKAKFVSDIADTRMSVAEAKADIDRRSLGVMSAVVYLYGKE